MELKYVKKEKSVFLFSKWQKQYNWKHSKKQMSQYKTKRLGYGLQNARFTNSFSAYHYLSSTFDKK